MVLLTHQRTPQTGGYDHGTCTAQDSRYLVLNYEMFQQADSPRRVRRLVERETIDLVVVDELHHAKQRQIEGMSQRRRTLLGLLTAADERNRNLRVLGLSATPVINNLQEGKSLLELISGLEAKETTQ